jgi:hypothetical protein
MNKCKEVVGKLMFKGADNMTPWLYRNRFFRKRKIFEKRPNRGVFARIMMRKGAFRRSHLRTVKLWPSKLHRWMPI